jgi:hypothetical protein
MVASILPASHIPLSTGMSIICNTVLSWIHELTIISHISFITDVDIHEMVCSRFLPCEVYQSTDADTHCHSSVHVNAFLSVCDCL